MSDFRMIRGFEDVWRPPVRSRGVRPEAHSLHGGGKDIRARLARVAARVPEVMVKVTGRTHGPAHLASHLTYITRNGGLPAEDRDGLIVAGRGEVAELAQDWAAAQLFDSRRRSNSPFSVALILSMPAGVDPIRLRDAARAFAQTAFADFDYVLALHTDTPHPHVHLTVRALGDDGRRLNPNKADLEAWRQRFAETLRERGVAAEATPRRARGVTRKPERTVLRKLRERAQAGRTPMGRVQRAAYGAAAQAAFGTVGVVPPWEHRIAERQRRVRAIYLAQARLLQASSDEQDRALGKAVEVFVRGMPAPDSQRLALARELRQLNQAAKRTRASPARDRS